MTRSCRTGKAGWAPLFAAAVAAVLAFCVGTVRAQTSTDGQARRGTVGGSAFATALAREYRTYIRAESRRYPRDFWRRHFERKARQAEDGRDISPDTPGFWRVGGASGVALREGRVRLMRALGAGARRRVPAIAARTQVSYDCWLSRAAGRYSAESIDECRYAFFDQVNQLEDAVLPIRATSIFDKTLAREYFAYAGFEAKDQKDLIDSRHFAAKAVMAAGGGAGRPPPPEVLARWNLLSGREVSTFVTWRERLMRVLALHRRSQKARIAALAQARFDCWVERTSERNDAAHIQKCRTEFLGYMRQLGARLPRQRTRSFMVYFRFGDSDLGSRQQQVVRAAARHAVEWNARLIQVVGHTDRAGRARDNLRLSFRRSERVAALLRRFGVRPDRIRTLHVGEAQPAVKTPDGVRNRFNRRAVIVIR